MMSTGKMCKMCFSVHVYSFLIMINHDQDHDIDEDHEHDPNYDRGLDRDCDHDQDHDHDHDYMLVNDVYR